MIPWGGIKIRSCLNPPSERKLHSELQVCIFMPLYCFFVLHQPGERRSRKRRFFSRCSLAVSEAFCPLVVTAMEFSKVLILLRSYSRSHAFRQEKRPVEQVRNCVCVFPQALCAAVEGPNVLPTMELVFSGADVMCATGDPAASTPYLLAQRAGQRLQMEFLHHNKLTGESHTPQPHHSLEEPTHT